MLVKKYSCSKTLKGTSESLATGFLQFLNFSSIDNRVLYSTLVLVQDRTLFPCLFTSYSPFFGQQFDSELLNYPHSEQIEDYIGAKLSGGEPRKVITE